MHNKMLFRAKQFSDLLSHSTLLETHKHDFDYQYNLKSSVNAKMQKGFHPRTC